MKTDIHPKMYDVVFVDISTGAQFITQSTKKTDETMKIDGKEYFVIKVEVSSDSHPFYTGKQKLIDSGGRVEKFMAKMKKAQELAEKNVKKVKKDEEPEEVAKETSKETIEDKKEEKAEEKDQKEESKKDEEKTEGEK